MSVVPLDVTDPEAVRAAVATVREELGGIDLAVLNAGYWKQMKISNLDTEEIAKHFAVNVQGTMNCFAGVIDEMIEARSGTVAFVASVSGYRGIAGSLAYGGTKAALINMAEALRSEAVRKGVSIVTVNPGFVRTPLTESNDFPMPFLMEPEEAARAIADGLESNRQEIAFPLPLVAILKVARILPVRVWTFISSRMAKSG